MPVRKRLRITGVVQGVGFRPFLVLLARHHHLVGFVGNDAQGVFAEVQGGTTDVEAFIGQIRAKPPALSRVDHITQADLAPVDETGFRIVPSRITHGIMPELPPDVAVCTECLREMRDPANRRHRYPFIVCTQCGPRFSLISAFPYDRANTTMRAFDMCANCAREYADPANRRFHAQPIACPVCGPWLTLADAHGNVLTERDEAVAHTRAHLQAGSIVAIKGIGGFHLACDAGNPDAVRRLRARKHRPHKPLAMMCATAGDAAAWAVVDEAAQALLESAAAPIVLLPKRHPGESVLAPDNGYLGIMLPYSPLHHLLFEGNVFASGLVMTSGNLSEEPICTRNEDALARLSAVADYFLLHNRDIFTACDDSVVGIWHGQPQFVRRSRGYAPATLALPGDVAPALATGGDLKNVFCLAQGRQAHLSQHLGDLEHPATQDAFAKALRLFEDAHSTHIIRVAFDAHPGYFSARYARQRATQQSLPAVAVQHHHAHAAALMAEHGLATDARIIAIAFDGTGYGQDGAIWGGEALVAGYAAFERVAQLAYAPLPGGDASVRRPYRTALAQLYAHGMAWDEALPCVKACPPEERRILAQQLARNLNCTPCSSMGRLFDAAAAMIGACQISTHEAQAASVLEALALQSQVTDSYPAPLVDGVVMLNGLWKALARDVQAQRPAAEIARAFHNTVIAIVLEMALLARRQSGLNIVGLTGGCFHNRLLAAAVPMLQDAGFDVLFHTHVPPGDGGLALGQMAILASQERAHA